MIQTLSACMDRLERISRFIAVACLLAVMFIVFTDVAARYLLHAPLPWS